jgi:hybrid cluster-associated redox disulfide protein
MCGDQPIKPDMSEDISVETFLRTYPKAAEVFIAHTMACVGCLLGSFHTLAQAADIYGLDIDQFMNELRNKNARQQALQSGPENLSQKPGEDPSEKCGAAG